MAYMVSVMSVIGTTLVINAPAFTFADLTPARLHLHLTMQDCRQPQCKRMAHDTKSSLRMVHSGCHVLLMSLFQPHSLMFLISY